MIPVVISGIGHCSSAGMGVPALKRAWLDGVRPEAKIEMVKTARGERGVPVIRAPAVVLPKLVPEAVERRMSRFAKMSMMTAVEAMTDAGILQPENPQRTGMVVGSAFGSLDLANVYQRRILNDGPGGASPSLFAASIHNSLAAQLTLTFGIRGPNSTVATMEQTAIASLRLAYDWIQQDIVDRVVVVLGDELSEYHLYYFAHLDGIFTAGEGLVTLVLERADLAQKKYARMAAPSLNSSANEGTIYRAGAAGKDTHAALFGGTVMGMAFELALAALTVERDGKAVTCVQECRKLLPQSVVFSQGSPFSPAPRLL